MEKVKTISKKMLLSYRNLPEKKQYVEFFTAVLTVPVLITVIALNVNNLKALKNGSTPPPANVTTNSAPQKIIITVPVASGGNSTTSDNSTKSDPNGISPTQAPCKQGIGSVSIDNPQEGDTIIDNPTSIDISYNPNGYCAVVWSYRINGGSWSDYDDKSIALFNLPQGNITLDLRVKSVVPGGEKDLTRHFVYKGPSTNSNISPTIDETKSSSASAN